MAQQGLDTSAMDRARVRGSAGAWSLEHLRVCWPVLLVVGAILASVSALVSGGAAAVSVAIGIVIVGAFFTTSAVIIARVGANHPGAVLITALAVYLAKILVLGIVILILPNVGYVQTRWMALAVVAGLFGWMGAHLRFVWHAKIFYVDPG